MSQILYGKVIADGIRAELADQISKLELKPTLAIVQIGDDPRSNIYIKRKIEFGESIGVMVKLINLNKDCSTEEVLGVISKLNLDNHVTGIIVQLPMPKHIERERVLSEIVGSKDVDGISGNSKFIPATARGVMAMLDYYNVKLDGVNAVVIGRSDLVGKPVAGELRKRGAIVTVCHKGTDNIPDIARHASVLVSAAGEAKLVTSEFTNPDQVIIDVGINSIEGGIVGDADFENIVDKVKAISPVPGGVGPLTVAMLFRNLFDAIIQGLVVNNT